MRFISPTGFKFNELLKIKLFPWVTNYMLLRALFLFLWHNMKIDFQKLWFLYLPTRDVTFSSVLKHSKTKYLQRQKRFFDSKKSFWKLLKCSFCLAESMGTLVKPSVGLKASNINGQNQPDSKILSILIFKL